MHVNTSREHAENILHVSDSDIPPPYPMPLSLDIPVEDFRGYRLFQDQIVDWPTFYDMHPPFFKTAAWHDCPVVPGPAGPASRWLVMTTENQGGM